MTESVCACVCVCVGEYVTEIYGGIERERLERYIERRSWL